MKILFKKINRGVILSIIVILCIVGYYVFLSIKTAPARKEMESLMTDFCETYAECVIVPAEYIKDYKTEEGVQPLVDSIREKFKPYFSDDEALDSFIEFFYSNNIESQTIGQNFIFTSVSMEFKKFSSLSVDFNKNTASAIATVGFDADETYYNFEFDDDGEMINKQGHNQHSDYDRSYSAQFAHNDDKWLISSFDYYRGY